MDLGGSQSFSLYHTLRRPESTSNIQRVSVHQLSSKMGDDVMNLLTINTHDSYPELCVHCRALDLNGAIQQADRFYESARANLVSRSEDLCKALDGSLHYNDAFLICHFQVRTTSESSCLFCQFLWAMRVHPGEHTKY